MPLCVFIYDAEKVWDGGIVAVSVLGWECGYLARENLKNSNVNAVLAAPSEADLL